MEGPQSLGEKLSSWTEEGKAEREPHRPLAPPPLTPQPEMRGRGWELRFRLQGVSSGERTGVGWVEGLGSGTAKG